MPDRGAWTALGPSDAPALVFVHGTRLTRGQWAAQLRLLSRTFRCIAVDLPGHGALADVPFTCDTAADLVAEAIAAEAADGRAVVVGLSLGGYVAVDTAERHPDRVAGLVLAGCSQEPTGPVILGFRTLAWVLGRGRGGRFGWANGRYFGLRYRPSIAGPVIDGGFWPEGGVRALRAVAGRPYLDRLARLWTPVLVINGALDAVFAPGGDSWAAACRRGRHVVIPRATHLVPLDRPRTFSRHVASFAREVFATP